MKITSLHRSKCEAALYNLCVIKFYCRVVSHFLTIKSYEGKDDYKPLESDAEAELSGGYHHALLLPLCAFDLWDGGMN